MMTENKMTESEIMKALEKALTMSDEPIGEHFYCGLTTKIVKEVQDLINRKNAEIARWKESLDKTIYKLEYLLCYATGSKLSKHTYELKTMYSGINDYIQKCCEEAKAEAIKEFAERVNTKIEDIFGDKPFYNSEVSFLLDQIAKEMGVEL